MLFAFKTFDNHFDLIQLSGNLKDYLISKNLVEEFYELYGGYGRKGAYIFLNEIGLSNESIMENLIILENIPKEFMEKCINEPSTQTNYYS